MYYTNNILLKGRHSRNHIETTKYCKVTLNKLYFNSVLICFTLTYYVSTILFYMVSKFCLGYLFPQTRRSSQRSNCRSVPQIIYCPWKHSYREYIKLRTSLGHSIRGDNKGKIVLYLLYVSLIYWMSTIVSISHRGLKYKK